VGSMNRPEQVFDNEALPTADLCVDAVYRGGRKGNASDDPFTALLNVSNMGGFRYRGSLAALELVVLTTTLADPEWPDELDEETGVFTYFGDNKRPGRALHDTPRNGNELLRRLFEFAHGGKEERKRVPPIFVFSNTGEWRDVVFMGLAVPGTADLRPAEDLVAIWKTSRGRRFQNYRARFTILDVPLVSRKWIADILARRPSSGNTPVPWSAWVETGQYRPLKASRSVEYRTKVEQLPRERTGLSVIGAIHAHFEKRPIEFEKCAAAFAMMLLPDIASLDLTRPSRDGGRDATGQLRIGFGPASILVDFALEAKCYRESESVGVRQVSRLISRLRHRQFGILVTTSYLDMYAYKEIKEDRHPVIVIAGADIVELLRRNGLTTKEEVGTWLKKEFPVD
jgi:Restriction endonuclease AspBHI N-terminal/Restriction endonuclease